MSHCEIGPDFYGIPTVRCQPKIANYSCDIICCMPVVCLPRNETTPPCCKLVGPKTGRGVWEYRQFATLSKGGIDRMIRMRATVAVQWLDTVSQDTVSDLLLCCVVCDEQ